MQCNAIPAAMGYYPAYASPSGIEAPYFLGMDAMGSNSDASFLPSP